MLQGTCLLDILSHCIFVSIYFSPNGPVEPINIYNAHDNCNSGI